MDKIDKIRQEIKRRRVFFEYNGETPDEMAWRCLGELLAFIDSLPNEPVNDDLKEAIKAYTNAKLDKTYEAYGEHRQKQLSKFDAYDLEEAIEYGANWQKERGTFMGPIHEKCSDCPFDRDVVFWKGMKHAIAEMKEDAVEAHVVESFNPCIEEGKPTLHAVLLLYEDEGKPYLVAGDDVRVIILPKED